MRQPTDSPVVLLIYNRPETTSRVFAEIARARPRTLLVVADGPRPGVSGDAERCLAARAVIEQVDWPCEVLTNYAETNMGCRRRVSSGLDWAFDKVEEAIILEDDCVPHPTFFRFCEVLLERYREDQRVMMVSGTNYLHKLDVPESYVFSRYYSVWGWASWRRAWRLYDVDMEDWANVRNQGQVDYLYPQAYLVKHVTRMFDHVYHHHTDTWDIQWFYCCLLNSGLCVVPRVNLISNIGEQGTHTRYTGGHPNFHMPTFELDAENLKHPSRVFANVLYDEPMFEKQIKVTLWQRLKRRLTVLSHGLRKQVCRG